MPNPINLDNLVELTEMAWATANTARITNQPMIVGKDLCGNDLFNQIRMTVFYNILASIIPKGQPAGVVRVKNIDETGEGWKEHGREDD